jgi:hypothetical protein
VNDQSTAELTVPSNFATDSATFQINKLDSTSLPEAPSGQTLAHNNIYDLIAVTENDEQLSDFSTAITFTVSYGSDTENDFDEDTLDVYKYNGTSWDKKNCILDTTANTLTCSLFGFSVYGVFGQSKNSMDGSTTSSSSSSSSHSTYSCGAEKPVGAPDLFQIDVTDSTAQLFFTPLSNTNRFFISFSSLETAEEHGADVALARDGVQNFTVNLLNPSTIYYFKVRGQNGCMPGDWSNVMKIRTNQNGYIIKSVYYKNSQFVEVPYMKASTEASKPVLRVADEIEKVIPPKKQILPSPKKKQCLFLWCW